MSLGEADGEQRDFPSTRWTSVLAARDRPERRRALLEELYRTRWQPLYLYARRKGLSPDRAEDAVQGLLLQLIEHDFLARLDPGRGRLRGYLKRALVHYLTNLHEHESAAKRGGGVRPLSLEHAEFYVASAPTDPDLAFEREWALGVFEAAFRALEREYEAGGRRGPASVLRQVFAFEDVPAYDELAKTHGMSVSQLKSFVHRGRQRFRKLVLDRIADTVAGPSEVNEELSDLMRVLRS